MNCLQNWGDSMDFDVTIDRDKYIGGSDIPAIMGLSPFTSRWELLLEKAGLKERDFSGNKYTEYGHEIEPKIRAYINEKYATCFEPNQVIDGDLRFHTDGFDGMCVLEIKSTSKIHETLDGYRIYLVQLIKYMEANKVECGILAVYHRPEDFDETFYPERLQEFPIVAKDYADLLEEVNSEIDRFRSDLARLKENPLLTEEDFQPKEVVKLSQAVEILERKMVAYKDFEAEYKRMKKALFDAMAKHNVKSWETFNGTKITRIDGTEASVKTVTEFDTEAFAESHPRLFKKFCIEIQKATNGKTGYVKITMPKG